MMSPGQNQEKQENRWESLLRKVGYVESWPTKQPLFCVTRGRLAIRGIFFFFLLMGIVGGLIRFTANRTLAASPPSTITYEGKVLLNNAAVTTTLSMKFVLYDALTAGNALYTAAGTIGTPTAVSITPTSGLFSIDLGAGSTNALDPTIFRDNSGVYLEVIIGSETLSPRKRINSSPYALNALYLNGVGTNTVSSSTYIPLSDSIGNFQFNRITSTAFYGSGTSTFTTTTVSSSTIGTANISNLNLFGTVTGLSLGSIGGTSVLAYLANNQTLTGLNTFSATTTFTTSTISSSTLTQANIQNLVVNGTLNLPANSVTDAMIPDTITASNYLLLAGGTLAGNLNLGNNAISNVSTLSVNSTLGVTGLSTLTGGFISNASSSFNRAQFAGVLGVSSTLLVSGTSTYYAGATTTIIDGQSLMIGKSTGFNQGLFYVNTASSTGSIVSASGTLIFSGTTGATPVEGAGTRLMWIPSKAAFRAGLVTADKWDAANIGTQSIAMGYDNQANTNSVAIGYGNNVTADTSYAFGYANLLTSGNSISGAFGNGNTISNGPFNYTFGTLNAVANAAGYALLVGQDNYAFSTAGGYASAFGAFNALSASGEHNKIFGSNNTISGAADSSLAVGRYNTVGGGSYSTAFGGRYGYVNANHSIVTNLYNTAELMDSTRGLTRNNTFAIANGYLTVGNWALDPAALTGTTSTVSVSGTLAIGAPGIGGLYVSSTIATTTLKSYASNSAGSAAFLFNTNAAFTSAQDRWLALFQNNGTNKVLISTDGTVSTTGGFFANTTSTFTTTTAVSSTIITANVTTGNIASLLGNTASLGSTLNVTGLSTFTGGFISNASSSIGANLQVAGVLNASSSLLVGNSFILNQGSGFNQGRFNLDSSGNLSASGTLAVFATSTFVTTTMASSTITTANVTSLFANTASIGTLTVASCTGCGSGSVSLSANQTLTGLNTFTATTTLATTTFTGNLLVNVGNQYDIGASSTQWRYLNLRQGMLIGDGSTTTTIDATQIRFREASGFALGRFYVDSSGNISASGTITAASNFLPIASPAVSTSTSRATTTVDAGSGFTGLGTSVIIGRDGLPLIAYYNSTDGSLDVAHCGNITCSSGNTTTTVDTGTGANFTGQYPSLAMGSDNLPIVSYYDGSFNDLIVAHCGNATCTSGNTTTTVDSANVVGLYTSLAIGTDGLAIISYQDNTNGNLKVVHCGNLLCSTSNTITIVDAGANVTGLYTSLAIGTDGFPVIAYNNSTGKTLDVAKCSSIICSDTANNVTSTLLVSGGNNRGLYTSLAIGTDGLPVVASYDAEATATSLEIIKCSDSRCVAAMSGGSYSESLNDVGLYTSIRIGPDGLPLVAYYDQTNTSLRLLRCFTKDCGTATSTLVDTGVIITGQYTSLVIGTDGLPLIAYHDNTNGDLNVAHCADITCSGTSNPGSLAGGSNIGSTGAFFNNVYANQFWGKRFQVAAFDVAEEYPTNDATLAPGEVVAFDSTNPGYVRRATDVSKVIGIISTQPGLVLANWKNDESSSYQVAVALAGRVPLKVNLMNGPIAIGDHLMLSGVPGVGAKADGSGPTIGIAMENFLVGPSGQIMVFVNIGASREAGVSENFTLDTTTKTITLGTSSTPYALAISDTLSFLSPTLNTISFATSGLFTSGVGDFAGARAFVLNAESFSPTSTLSLAQYILSLRSNNTPVFSVSAVGDVVAKGTYYGASATFGTSTNPGDLAERVDIAADDTVEAGDVASVDPNTPDTYRKSQKAYDQSVAGVISTNPTIIMGNGKTSHTGVLALTGRVPVKVTNENGNLSRGDLLVASSKPGHAMKYDPTTDNSERMVGVIGIALEPLTTSDGKILALIRTGWAFSQTKTIKQLQNDLVQLATAPISAHAAESLTVTGQGNTIKINQGILDLSAATLIKASAIGGVADRWAIDILGHFVTRIATSQGTKEMFAMQSPTSEFIFSGSATLTAGEATITFDQATSEIIDPSAPLKISLTLTAANSKSLYIESKNTHGFTVRELEGGTGNATFDWLVVAKRLEPTDSSASASSTTSSSTDQKSSSKETVPDTSAGSSDTTDSTSTEPAPESQASTTSTSESAETPTSTGAEAN